jgi:hypothetical protein
MLDDTPVKQAADGILEPQPNVRNLEKLRDDRNEDSGTNQKQQTENAPYDAVDLAIHVFQDLKKFVHHP